MISRSNEQERYTRVQTRTLADVADERERIILEARFRRASLDYATANGHARGRNDDERARMARGKAAAEEAEAHAIQAAGWAS